MRLAWLIARRELRAYFRSPLGCVVIASALLLDGILFYGRACCSACTPGGNCILAVGRRRARTTSRR
jgi:hypothetical protein